MRRSKALLPALICAIMPAAAGAADRVDRSHGIFFNRPGATRAEMESVRQRCAAIAGGADSQITGVNVLMSGLAGVIGGAVANARLVRVNTENCMVIAGWRLFAFTAKEGAAFDALPPAGREAELAGLVAAETPARGTLLRTWDNDYAEPKLWQKP